METFFVQLQLADLYYRIPTAWRLFEPFNTRNKLSNINLPNGIDFRIKILS